MRWNVSLRRVIELRPDYAHAYNALGYTFADRNVRLPEALQLIEKAHQLAPEDPFILDSLGWVYLPNGRPAAARKYLELAYDARPDAEVDVHLAEVLWAGGDQARARTAAARSARQGTRQRTAEVDGCPPAHRTVMGHRALRVGIAVLALALVACATARLAPPERVYCRPFRRDRDQRRAA